MNAIAAAIEVVAVHGTMMVRLVERAGVRFVECAEPITGVDDALGLITARWEHNSNRLLIDSGNFPETFFDLRSRFAGEFIEKVQNYRIRVAAVFTAEARYSDRFEEFLVEARRGRLFRAFTRREEAEAWLASGG